MRRIQVPKVETTTEIDEKITEVSHSETELPIKTEEETFEGTLTYVVKNKGQSSQIVLQ